MGSIIAAAICGVPYSAHHCTGSAQQLSQHSTKTIDNKRFIIW